MWLLPIAFLLAQALTPQQIVQAWLGGSSPESLVAKIETAEQIDGLDEEILEELRVAGLPATVLAALQAHLAAADDAEPEAPAGEESVREVAFAIDAPDGLSVLDALAVGYAEAYDLAPSESRADDLALFVAGLSSIHVPDQWRTRSPLGRDREMPRHAMLFFQGEAAIADEEGRAARYARRFGVADGKRITLALPASIVVPFPDEIEARQQVMVGIAWRVGGDYRLLSSKLITREDGDLNGLSIRIRGRGTALPELSIE